MIKGVNEQVSKEIQLRCWQLNDGKVKQSEIQLDYLRPLTLLIDKKDRSTSTTMNAE